MENQVMGTEPPLQVLFIDDEETLLDIGKLFLERTGQFLVTQAHDADEGISLLDKQTFDVIVSDYHMPRMDGIELLTFLKGRGDTTPFIIYTGRGREEVVINALNKGVDFYIQKAGDPKTEFTEMASKIWYAVRRKRSDIELKQALDSLKRSQQVANIGSWTLDLEKRIFTASDMGLALFGFPPGSFPTFDEVSSAIHPDDRPVAHNTLVRLLETGEPYNIDIRIYRHDTGELRYIQSQGQLIHGDQSEKVAVFGTNLDITERKKTEERLSETNLFLENLISIASVPIIIMNPEYQITRINQSGEELIGKKADLVVGKPIRILFPPASAETSMQEILSGARRSRRAAHQLDIIHTDGSVRTVLWNFATLYDTSGIHPVATIAQGQDITARLGLERQRDAAEQQIQQNLAQLAILNDGIRNPLMAISGYAELFGDEIFTEKIMLQVREINAMVTLVDRRWAESEKILSFLRKHCDVEAETSDDSDGENNTG